MNHDLFDIIYRFDINLIINDNDICNVLINVINKTNNDQFIRHPSKQTQNTKLQYYFSITVIMQNVLCAETIKILSTK